MAHEIGKRDIQVGIEMAWHELTLVVPRITAENCGILYPMRLWPLQANDPKHIANILIDTGMYIIVSEDDNLPIGGPVAKQYSMVPNHEIWDGLNDALNYTEHEIVSVGTIRDRERGFISVKLSPDFLAANRKTQSTLNILWGHDRILGIEAQTSFITVVCGNTFAAALEESDEKEFSFKIKHTGDSVLKLENMMEAVEVYAKGIEEYKYALDTMYREAVSKEEANNFFAGFLTSREDEEVSVRTNNQRDELNRLFAKGKGNSGSNQSDLFNATTDFYTHGFEDSKKDIRAQLFSSEYGLGLKRKTVVYDLLTGKTIARLGDYAACVRRGEKVLEKVHG